jgi:hypothetical protein
MADETKPSPEPSIPPLPDPSGERGPLDDPGGVNFNFDPPKPKPQPQPLKPGDLGPDGDFLA